MTDTQNCEQSEKNSVYAEEAFVVDVQSYLQTLMNEAEMSRADLAKALGVSRARVSQIFSDECKNLTVRLLARVVHALGDRAEVTSEKYRKVEQRESFSKLCEAIESSENVYATWHFSENTKRPSPRFVDVSCLNPANDVVVANTLRNQAAMSKRVAG